MANDQSTTGLVINDLPIDKTTQDGLGFEIYREVLSELIESPNNQPPLTIGVFGSWGTGKTSLMHLLKNSLAQNNYTIWFDAWKFSQADALWRAFLLEIVSALESLAKETSKDPSWARADSRSLKEEMETLREALYRDATWAEKTKGPNWPHLVSELLALGITVAMGGVTGILAAGVTEAAKEAIGKDTGNRTRDLLRTFQREEQMHYQVQLRSLEQFSTKFQDLVGRLLKQTSKRRLVVFVDDLDRCLPENAIDVLEAIKLFLEAKDCIFVLGIDPVVIARAIELKYRDLALPESYSGERDQDYAFSGTRYLEKLIQVPFYLPSVEHKQIEGFINRLVPPQAWPNGDCAPVFAQGLGENPRQIKRSLNAFHLLWSLAHKKGLTDVKPVQLAKLVVIQNHYPRLYAVLKRSPWLLLDMEKYYIEMPKSHGGSPVEPSVTPLPQELAPYMGDPVLRELFAMHREKRELTFSTARADSLPSYFSLAQQVESPLVMPAPSPGRPREHDMIQIPSDEKLSEFYIDRYLVTNADYLAFVEDSHYAPPWSNPDFPKSKPTHPVVFVSWEDAIAYCRWMSSKSGRTYRLPTTPEWEKAAGGVDGDRYPWGIQWDPQKANTIEGEKGGTTPVGQYSPGGDSPYGVADMAGNVWEWCENERSQDKPGRFLKGGAFDLDKKYARCNTPNWAIQTSRYQNVGFRVMRSA